MTREPTQRELRAAAVISEYLASATHETLESAINALYESKLPRKVESALRAFASNQRAYALVSEHRLEIQRRNAWKGFR